MLCDAFDVIKAIIRSPEAHSPFRPPVPHLLFRRRHDRKPRFSAARNGLAPVFSLYYQAAHPHARRAEVVRRRPSSIKLLQLSAASR